MPCWKATRSGPRRWSRSLSSSGQAGCYRWVGLYEVTEQEIVAIGWSGPGAPVYPRFPVTQGSAARPWRPGMLSSSTT
jgi:hypothetical protein